MRTFKTVDSIKQAVDMGIDVYHKNSNYHVIKDSLNQYLIECQSNGYCIGLTWRDGTTLNGQLKDFYIN